MLSWSQLNSKITSNICTVVSFDKSFAGIYCVSSLILLEFIRPVLFVFFVSFTIDYIVFSYFFRLIVCIFVNLCRLLIVSNVFKIRHFKICFFSKFVLIISSSIFFLKMFSIFSYLSPLFFQLISFLFWLMISFS